MRSPDKNTWDRNISSGTDRTHLRRKGRRKLLAGFLLAVSLFLTGLAMPFSAFASDAPVVAGEEPEDAEKGEVLVCAAVMDGMSPVVHVELIPEFEEGICHEYTLSNDNGYSAEDYIMTGEYGCICYTDSRDTEAVYGGDTQAVTVNGGPACFVAVAGDKGFTYENAWLSDYRTSDGECLKGRVSDKELSDIMGRLVAMQTAEDDDDPGTEDKIEAPPEDYDSPIVYDSGQDTAEDAVQEAEPDDEIQDQGPGNMWPIALFVFALVFVIASLSIIAARKKKEVTPDV